MCLHLHPSYSPPSSPVSTSEAWCYRCLLSMWLVSFLTHPTTEKESRNKLSFAPNLFPAATRNQDGCVCGSLKRGWRIPGQALLTWASVDWPWESTIVVIGTSQSDWIVDWLLNLNNLIWFIKGCPCITWLYNFDFALLGSFYSGVRQLLYGQQYTRVMLSKKIHISSSFFFLLFKFYF